MARLASAVALLLCLASPMVLTQSPSDGVVRVRVVRADGPGQGTGFFTSREGQVMTAYHVVEGARQITLIHERLGPLGNVIVESISPAHDLAVLRAINLLEPAPAFSLDQSTPLGSEQYRLPGYPRDGMQQVFSAQSTRPGYTSSATIRHLRGEPLFAQAIDVVPLDGTIYTGMSGGPVIGPRGVVGILSGSYQEGGTLAWAIPVKYLPQMVKVNQAANQITWPRLTLMAPGWHHLRASVRLNNKAAGVYDRYLTEIETMAGHYAEITRSAIKTVTDMMYVRPFLDRVAKDAKLSGDTEAANQLAGDPLRAVLTSMDAFSRSSMDASAASQQLNTSLVAVFTWIADGSNVSNTTGQQLVAQMRRVRDEYKDISVGLDQYLNLPADKLLQSAPDHKLALQKASTAGQRAQAYLRYFDVWLPAYRAYASGQALMFMARDVQKHRRMAHLFERIVYPDSSK